MSEALFLLLIIATGQGLFLFLYLLLQKRKKQWANVMLAFLFLAFSLQLSDFALLFSGKAIEYPQFVFMGTPFNFAFGPLLLLYLSNFESSLRRFTGVDVIHFIPFLLHVVYIITIFHTKGIDYKVDFLQQVLEIQSLSQPYNFSEIVFPLVIYVHFTIYMWLSHQKIAKRDVVDQQALSWQKKLWISIVIIGCFGFVQFLFLLLNVHQQPYTGYIAIVLAIIYIYSGAIIVMRRPDVIFKPLKYQYSDLRDDDRTMLISKLKEYMQVYSPYKNPRLTLKDLAAKTSINDRHLSQIINENLGKNFSDFLNEYRVQEFKEQLKNPTNDHLSMLGIATSCGFNSKSTFNTVFKRIARQTPSDYKKDIEEKK